MVTKRKPVKRKKNASARVSGHPASVAPEVKPSEEALKTDTKAENVADLGTASTPSIESMPIIEEGMIDDVVISAEPEKDSVESQEEIEPTQTDSSKETQAGEPEKEVPVGKPHKVGKKRKSAKKTTKASQLNPKVRAALIALVSVLAACMLLVGVFSWDRWFRYDDTLDFVGEWQIHNSEATILIDGERMMLASDAVLDYTLDTRNKTIEFTLGTMKGGGRYRFSADRNQLVIEDGNYGSWLSNALNDASWQFNQLMHAWFGAPLKDPTGDGMSVLHRAGVSSDGVEAEATPDEQAAQDATQDTTQDALSYEDGAVTDESAASSDDDQDADNGSQKQSGQQTDEEFQGSQSSGAAGGNAVTLEELQGLA